MAAYLITSLLEITDQDAMEEYRSKIVATYETYGGKLVAADPEFEVMEGEWESNRVVILEFPDMNALKGWYNSDEYKPLLEKRLGASTGNLIFVNGL